MGERSIISGSWRGGRKIVAAGVGAPSWVTVERCSQEWQLNGETSMFACSPHLEPATNHPDGEHENDRNTSKGGGPISPPIASSWDVYL